MTKAKIVICLIFVAMAGSKCVAANPSTPSVVVSFYSAMEQLSKETSATKAYDLQKIMQYCFLYGKPDENHNVNSGIEIPNDFYDLGYKDKKRMSSTLYTQMFKDKAFSKNGQSRLQVKNVHYVSNSYAQEIDLRQFVNESTPFIRTFVTRTFVYGKTSIAFNDTILTKDNKIYAFCNGRGNDSGEENLETLRALAAQYASAKQYKRAFQTYEKIIKIDKDNANAYYRLGILAFWYGKKCGFYSTASSRQKGKDYMRRAYYQRALNADRVLYYMEHPASI